MMFASTVKALGRSLSFGFARRKRSFYEILQVSPSASKQQIKGSYYNLVKKYHPDVSANTEYIKILNEAYSVLCDEEARKKYNEEKGLNIVKQPEMQENRMQEPRQQEEYNRTYRQRKRMQQNTLGQMLLRNFVVGMLLTGFIIIVFGVRSPQPQFQMRNPPKQTYTGRDFEGDFQNSLLTSKSKPI